MIRLLILLGLGITAGALSITWPASFEEIPLLGVIGLAIAAAAQIIDMAVSTSYSSRPSALIARARHDDRIFAGRVERVATSRTNPNTGAVDVDLFVASYPEAPFHTRTTTVLAPHEQPRYEVGNLVSVAHPDPRYNRVVLTDQPVLAGQRENFTRSRSALEPRTLPPARTHTPWVKLAANSDAGGMIRTVLYVLAFGAGLAIALLLTDAGPGTATPQPPSASPEATQPEPTPSTPDESPSEDPTTEAPPPPPPPVNEPVDMFDEDRVRQALDDIAGEMGHSEVFEITLHDSFLTAEVATSPGADTADSVMHRYGRVYSQKPAPIQPRQPDVERFLMSDVDVEVLFDLMGQLPAIAERNDIPDQEMTHVIIDMDETGFYGGVLVIRLYTSSDYHSMMVVASSDGTILRE